MGRELVDFHQLKVGTAVSVTVRIVMKNTDPHQVMFLEMKVAVMRVQTTKTAVMHLLAPVLLIQNTDQLLLQGEDSKS